jgi:hypothetical protein
MTDKQIDDFITKAGMIYWDNAKSYSISVIANTSNATSSGDSIVILPVALPNDNNINAVLVARLLANGYDITYSIHYKSDRIRYLNLEDKINSCTNLIYLVF